MRKYLFLVYSVLLVWNTTAQDVILLKNNTQIKGKVIKVGMSEIEYNKEELPDGPAYSISKKETLKITYKNGYVEEIAALDPNYGWSLPELVDLKKKNNLQDFAQKKKVSISNVEGSADHFSIDPIDEQPITVAGVKFGLVYVILNKGKEIQTLSFANEYSLSVFFDKNDFIDFNNGETRALADQNYMDLMTALKASYGSPKTSSGNEITDRNAHIWHIDADNAISLYYYSKEEKKDGISTLKKTLHLTVQLQPEKEKAITEKNKQNAYQLRNEEQSKLLKRVFSLMEKSYDPGRQLVFENLQDWVTWNVFDSFHKRYSDTLKRFTNYSKSLGIDDSVLKEAGVDMNRIGVETNGAKLLIASDLLREDKVFHKVVNPKLTRNHSIHNLFNDFKLLDHNTLFFHKTLELTDSTHKVVVEGIEFNHGGIVFPYPQYLSGLTPIILIKRIEETSESPIKVREDEIRNAYLQLEKKYKFKQVDKKNFKQDKMVDLGGKDSPTGFLTLVDGSVENSIFYTFAAPILGDNFIEMLTKHPTLIMVILR